MKIKRIVSLLFALVLCTTFSNAVRVNAETEASALAACSHSSCTVVGTQTSEQLSHTHQVVTSVTSSGQFVYSTCEVYVSYTIITKRCNNCNLLIHEKTPDQIRHTLPWADNNPYNP